MHYPEFCHSSINPFWQEDESQLGYYKQTAQWYEVDKRESGVVT